jgi:hypothetical protein
MRFQLKSCFARAGAILVNVVVTASDPVARGADAARLLVATATSTSTYLLMQSVNELRND